MSHSAIVFDLDDTLIRCSEYYRAADETLITGLSQASGMPKEEIKKHLISIEETAISLPNGFALSRLPTSYRLVSELLSCIRGHPQNLWRDDWAAGVAWNVYRQPYEVFPGIHDMLRMLRSESGKKLILVTKGDEHFQRSKIERNNLEQYFHEIHVVPQKNEATLKRILDAADVCSQYSWYLGDSTRDDMIPALACGLQAVQIRKEHPHLIEDLLHPKAVWLDKATDFPLILFGPQ